MDPYLVQRLLEKPKNDRQALASKVWSFGGGGSGMSDEAWEHIQEIVDIDYMGAAEFEFGAFPKCLTRIINRRDEYSCWMLEFGDEQIKKGAWRRWTKKLKDGSKVPPKPKSSKVFVIGPSDQRPDVESLILRVGTGEAHLKESACFDLDPNPDYARSKPPVGWLDIKNDVAWFLDEDTRDAFAAMIGVKKD